MGGAASNGLFTSETQARDYADLIWKMFMGGSDPSIPRPFGDAIFDGIDLDIEGGSPVGYGTFVNRLREWYARDDQKTYYIAGAPQCPFPDAYLGPTGGYSGYALGTSWFDFIFVQVRDTSRLVSAHIGDSFIIITVEFTTLTRVSSISMSGITGQRQVRLKCFWVFLVPLGLVVAIKTRLELRPFCKIRSTNTAHHRVVGSEV